MIIGLNKFELIRAKLLYGSRCVSITVLPNKRVSTVMNKIEYLINGLLFT